MMDIYSENQTSLTNKFAGEMLRNAERSSFHSYR
jgi:hypothetical protein